MLALVYLAHCAAVVLGGAFLVWLISLLMRDASIIDIFWGFGFALVGATCLWLAHQPGGYPLTPYQWLMGLMPVLWGLRLTAYLARRNLGHGEDPRYVAMRKRSGMGEMAWRVRALFTIYFGQGLLILIVSAPVWVAVATAEARYRELGFPTPGINGGPGQSVGVEIGVLALTGAALWLAGVLFEAIGDMQLRRFMKTMRGYDGPYADKPVLDTGLWAWTRHPNYFGNALLWWGIFIAACQAPWGWLSFPGPLIMTLLLVKVSGRDLLERQMMKRHAYRDYAERTSSFLPMPPKRS